MEITIISVSVGVLLGLFAGSVAVLASIHFQLKDDSEKEENENQKNDTDGKHQN